jgi:hypothetical protein
MVESTAAQLAAYLRNGARGPLATRAWRRRLHRRGRAGYALEVAAASEKRWRRSELTEAEG